MTFFTGFCILVTKIMLVFLPGLKSSGQAIDIIDPNKNILYCSVHTGKKQNL